VINACVLNQVSSNFHDDPLYGSNQTCDSQVWPPHHKHNPRHDCKNAAALNDMWTSSIHCLLLEPTNALLHFTTMHYYTSPQCTITLHHNALLHFTTMHYYTSPQCTTTLHHNALLHFTTYSVFVVKMYKTFKTFMKTTPTCFGRKSDHHQGVNLYLAKNYSFSYHSWNHSGEVQ
jgi:hypothetical protein